MRWIEDKVFANEEYKEERARLEAQCNRLLASIVIISIMKKRD